MVARTGSPPRTPGSAAAGSAGVGRAEDQQLQWDATEDAGFTDGAPWEPVNSDHGTVNVAAEQDDPESLLNHYRTLLGIRQAHPALSLGSVQVLEDTCPGVHATLRRTPDGSDTVLVMLNFGSTPATGCVFSATNTGLTQGTVAVRDLMTGASAADPTVDEGGSITGYVPLDTLRPREAAILHLEP